jgi:hypothetical protein
VAGERDLLVDLAVRNAVAPEPALDEAEARWLHGRG